MGQQKLNDVDLARLRALAAEGRSQAELAREFGVGRQHVSRLLRGAQRAVVATPAVSGGRSGGVVGAVERFLSSRDLDAGEDVLAETARALAVKLDSCSSAETAQAAMAAPRVAQALVDVIARLRAGGPHEPTPLDLLQQRREARILLRAASNHINPHNGGTAA